MSSHQVDVLVVGAGPAGSTAARELSTSGARVVVLDRARFPRNKPCGGGISMRVLPRFPYLEKPLERIDTHYLSRLYLEGPDGRSTVVTSDGPAALMIRRVEFDALLASLAQDAGADLISGVDVVQARQDASGVTVVARDGREFRAPIVVAADGVHSIVARRLGINPGWPAAAVALDMMEETPRSQLRDVDPSTLWVAYGYEPRPESAAAKKNGTPEGYAYIFPKRDHVNIGIGYVLSHYREHVDAAPYDLQRGLVGRLRARGIVEGESVRGNFTPFIIPVGGPLRRPGRGRVIAVGDAAGFVNGFTAEGIYYAMVSGQLAARSIVQSGKDAAESLVDRFTRLVNYEIGVELRDSVRIQRYLFADRRRIARVIDGANRDAKATRLILELAMGRLPYRVVRRRLLAGAPALAVEFLWDRLRRWR